MGGLERAFEGNDACEAEAGIEVDVENEDEDVVAGFAHVGLLGYESEGFTLSEIVRRKRNAKKSGSESLVDTTHLPQFSCEIPFF